MLEGADCPIDGLGGESAEKTRVAAYRPLDAKTWTPAPEEMSTEFYRPLDASTWIVAPEETEEEIYRPLDASTWTVAPEEASVDIYRPLDVSSWIPAAAENINSSIFACFEDIADLEDVAAFEDVADLEDVAAFAGAAPSEDGAYAKDVSGTFDWSHLAMAAAVVVDLAVLYYSWLAIWRSLRRADGEGGRRFQHLLQLVAAFSFWEWAVLVSGAVSLWLTMVEQGKFAPFLVAWLIWVFRGTSPGRIDPIAANYMINTILAVEMLAGVESFESWCRGPLTAVLYSVSIFVQLLRAMCSLVRTTPVGMPTLEAFYRSPFWSKLVTCVLILGTSSRAVLWWTFWLAAFAYLWPEIRDNLEIFSMLVVLLVCVRAFSDGRFHMLFNAPKTHIPYSVILFVILPHVDWRGLARGPRRFLDVCTVVAVVLFIVATRKEIAERNNHFAFL